MPTSERSAVAFSEISNLRFAISPEAAAIATPQHTWSSRTQPLLLRMAVRDLQLLFLKSQICDLRFSSGSQWPAARALGGTSL
jgi:hypothetical protein